MPKTLLVVDDSATMRKVFELTFGGEDVTVVTHDGGDSLLARAREVRPAAAIVDVSLGHTSGYDVCRSLKGDDSIPRFPVLLLYSEQNPLDEARAREVGSDGSLVKPFDTQAAIDKVRALLGSAPSPALGPMVGVSGARPTAPGPAPVAASAAPPGPPPGMARAPGSAGVGNVGTAPAPGSAPKHTQAFAPGGVPAMGMPPLSSATRPPAASSLKPAPSPEPDIELEMDDEEELAPPTPVRAAPPPPAPAPTPAPVVRAAPHAPAPVAAPPTATHAPVIAHSPALNAEVQQRVAAMGLTPAQADAVAALTRDVVERVVWEVVPQLAETLIREEIRRLTAE